MLALEKSVGVPAKNDPTIRNRTDHGATGVSPRDPRIEEPRNPSPQRRSRRRRRRRMGDGGGSLLPGLGANSGVAPRDEAVPEEVWEDIDEHETEEAAGRESLLSRIVERRRTGFQSDMGPSYAGGMVYDFTRHAAYLTGSSYGPPLEQHKGDPPRPRAARCFLSSVALVAYEWDRWGDDEDETGVQACNAIAQNRYSYDQLYLAGFQVHDPKRSLYSVLSHLERSPQHPDWTPVVNNWLQETTVPVGVPVAMEVDHHPKHSGIFVLGMQSTDASPTRAFANHADPDFPNLTPGAIGRFKYGADRPELQQMAIQHYRPSNDPNQPKLVVDWANRLSPQATVNDDDDKGKVHYIQGTGLLPWGDELFVVGSLAGRVPLLEAALEAAGAPRPPTTRADADGFVVALRTSSGQLDPQRIRKIDSADHRDDWVLGICGLGDGGAGTPQDQSKAPFVYVVGATKGRMGSGGTGEDAEGTWHPFVAKLETATLETVWTKQFTTHRASSSARPAIEEEEGGLPLVFSAAAYGCALTESSHEDVVLYVAGVATDGSTLSDGGGAATASAGGNDVFVARLDPSTGSPGWLVQLGSAGDEGLARSGGVATDMHGNAILYGDTTGELFRARSPLLGNGWPWSTSGAERTSDVFVVTLDRADGACAPTVETIRARLWWSLGLVLLALVFLLWRVRGCLRNRRPRNEKPSGLRYFPDDDDSSRNSHRDAEWKGLVAREEDPGRRRGASLEMAPRAGTEGRGANGLRPQDYYGDLSKTTTRNIV